MLNNEPLTTTFINSMLNQLNWAFSEFIGMLQEIQNISSRPERVFIESRQLKICATCFDLSLALLRVLEMVSNIAPGVFTDPDRPNSELLLSRLYQVRFAFSEYFWVFVDPPSIFKGRLKQRKRRLFFFPVNSVEFRDDFGCVHEILYEELYRHCH